MDLAELHLVLCDPNRRRVLDLVLGGERTVSDLIRTTRLRQPLVSHHLRVLRGAGLVAARREGRFRLYRVATPEVEKLLRRLEDDGRALLEAAAQAEEPPRGQTEKAPAAALRARRGRA